MVKNGFYHSKDIAIAIQLDCQYVQMNVLNCEKNVHPSKLKIGNRLSLQQFVRTRVNWKVVCQGVSPKKGYCQKSFGNLYKFLHANSKNCQ